MKVNRAVPHDRVNPRLEGGGPSKSREMQIGVQPRVLYGVVCVRHRSEKQVRSSDSVRRSRSDTGNATVSPGKSSRMVRERFASASFPSLALLRTIDACPLCPAPVLPIDSKPSMRYSIGRLPSTDALRARPVCATGDHVNCISPARVAGLHDTLNRYTGRS